MLRRFPDGVWFCELATASDEVLMFHAVADAVGARRREGMSMADSIVEYLRDREVLVVLDNCEHLLADAARLASKLLQRCPKVRVLATSREGLGVGGRAAGGVVVAVGTRRVGRRRRHHRIGGDPALRRPGGGGAGGVHAGTRESRVGGGDLPASRRHAVSDRASGGAGHGR